MNEQMNMLLELLEEIKQQNREIIKEVSKKNEGAANANPDELTDVKATVLAFGQSYAKHLTEHSKWKKELTDVVITLGQRLTDIREGQANFNTQQTAAFNLLSNRISEAQAPSITKKYFLLDAKRWIQWAIWGVLILLTAGIFGWNIHLYRTNRSLNDYALRYRILRMQHSVSNDSFAQLDSIFETHRSEDTINQLRERVTSYEAAIQRQAELLHRQQQLSAEQEKVQQQLNP